MPEEITDCRPKILLIDDEPLVHQVIQNTFEETYEVLCSENGKQGIDLARQEAPDVILLDVAMPEMDGYEVQRQLKLYAETDHIPVIFLTGLCTLEDECHGLEHGAKDYITKPFSPSVVKLRVEHALTDGQQRSLENANPGIDELTKLANRRSFEEAFDKEWRRTSRSHSGLSLALVQIDHFGLYLEKDNDGCSDELLKAVALTLDTCVHRPADLIARINTNEFAVLLPETDAESAMIVASRMLQAIREMNIPHFHPCATQPVSISVGGVYSVFGAGDPDTLLQSARNMLDRAIENGGNQVVWEDD